MTTRETVTAVILTKNEAGKIRRCLNALRWVDELIVVDGDSTDGTPAICQERGATVVDHATGDDFGEARNTGNAHATCDWILQLDADEVVTDALREAIEHALRNRAPYAAYQCRRRNHFLNHPMRHGGWDHYALRLFRRGRARYHGRVHETLVVDGPIGTLEAPLDHYPFSSLSQFLDRQNRYTTLAAQELVEQRRDIPLRELRYQLLIKPLKLFWKFYVKKRGYRDGTHGLVFSGLYSFVHFLKWAKVWELATITVDNPPPVSDTTDCTVTLHKDKEAL